MQNITELSRSLALAGVPFKENELMSRHTTFAVGGAAALFIEPVNEEQIAEAQRLCRESGTKLFTLGRGSNLLVQDGGLPFAVLHIGSGYSTIERTGEYTVSAESGAKLSALCRYTAEQGLSGLEFAYGIPGSVGGAVYMNAGAYGGEMQSAISRVTFLDPDGKKHTLSTGELCFSYRHSFFTGKDCIILSSELELTHDDPQAIKSEMDIYMERRRDKQPLEFGSAGSTFKRPEGAFASALIDQCGLKGYAVGGAQVSRKHAGFVINTGCASSADVHAVMEHVIATVREKTGFLLEPEVMLLP